MLWDMHLCVFDVRLSFENRVGAMCLHCRMFWSTDGFKNAV